MEVSFVWRDDLWRQFGAAIHAIENAIDSCPEELWNDRTRRPEFWYVAFHTLFWLDYYLSDPVDGFAPPAPFALEELDPAGVLPERIYTRAELRTYLKHCRAKASQLIESLSDSRAIEKRKFHSIQGSVLEVLLYNLRHVQHHAGQLHLLLRQETDSAPRWVSQARSTAGSN